MPWEVQAAILSFLPVPPTVGCACPENCDEVFEAMSLPVRPLKKGWYSRHFKGTLGYVLVPLLDSLLTPPISQHTLIYRRQDVINFNLTSLPSSSIPNFAVIKSSFD